MRCAPALRLLKHLLVLLLVALVSGFMWKMSAYDYYSNFTKPDGLGNCASCHELAVGGFQGRSTLHRAHTNLATSTCQLCHTQTGDIPRLSVSGEPGGVGCIGCHGQPLVGGTSSGAGLRLHHTNVNVPPDQEGFTCISCHSSDPIPAPENVVPVYYGRTDVLQNDPCNSDGREDFWSRNTGQPDGRGLDNDGDLLVDGLEDPDCGAIACVDGDQDGYGDPGDPSCPNGPALDCDDTRGDVFPGAIEAYDLVDNNCNGLVDEIENSGFNDPLNPNHLTWGPQLPAGQLYDVIRSDGPQFFPESPSSACLAQATPMESLDDLLEVPPGKTFYYLVRNTLVSDYGQTSNGTLRLYTVCP